MQAPGHAIASVLVILTAFALASPTSLARETATQLLPQPHATWRGLPLRYEGESPLRHARWEFLLRTLDALLGSRYSPDFRRNHREAVQNLKKMLCATGALLPTQCQAIGRNVPRRE